MRLSGIHMKTLMKLNEMALKHNCYITMGVDVINDANCNMDVIQKVTNMSDGVREDIANNLNIKSEHTSGYNYYFELIDMRENAKTKHNILTYIATDTYFSYDVNDLGYFEEDVQEYFLDVDSEEHGYISACNFDQTIQGFAGVDTTEINVYREGMLLKFFGDLVCDYLGEERIKEVY